MAMTLESLISELQQLSRSDQRQLVRFLLIELEGEQETGWEDSWSEELQRRRSLEAEGKLDSIPWDQALGELRERYP